MISKMRDFAPVVMWVVIAAFVATIFFAWGMDFTSNKREGLNIGKIGTENVPAQTFMRKVEQQQEQLRQQNNGTEPSAEQLRQIPRQIWEAEVQRVLLTGLFGKMALSGSSDEVFAYICDNPPPQVSGVAGFQTNGQFDKAKFVKFLNDPKSYDQPGLVELETYTRNMLVPAQKLQILLTAGKTPSRLEVEREFRDQSERAKFEFAGVNTSSFAVNPSTVTEAMIKGYYTAHPDSFKTEAMAELYFAAIPKIATAEDDRACLEEMLDVKKSLESGSSVFAEEAKSISDDEGSAKQGGELGWFGRGQMVPQFEQVAFSIDTGKVSDPVRTQFGWHIIKVSEREVKGDSVIRVRAFHILRKVEASTETLDSLEEVAENLRAKMAEKGFVAVANNEKGLVWDSTGLFLPNKPIPKVGFLSGASVFAFAKDHKEKISDKLENKGAFFVLGFKRSVGKGTLDLADVRSRIVSALADSISSAHAKDFLEGVRTRLAAVPSIARLDSADSRLFSGISDTVTRATFVPQLGYNDPAVATAFILAPGTLSKVVKIDGKYVLVKTLWSSPAVSAPKSGPEIDKAVSTLATAAMRTAYMQWYMSYRTGFAVTEQLDRYYE